MADAKARSTIIDFSNVKDRGQFNPRHIESGEYPAKITKVIQDEAKDGEDMWVFTFVLDEVPRATYPYYCKLVDNQFWKVKAMFEAAGISVGKRKIKVDPNKLVGKRIGVFMEDDEYEGRLKSVISECIKLSEISGPAEDDDDDLEEDEEEEAPRPKKKRRPAPEPEDDEDDEEEDEDEEEPEPPRKKAAKKVAKKAPAKKRKPAPVEDEDEDEEDDEELEIDEL